MLNSMQLPPTTDQFALKFQSMFNLAIATQQQRYSATHFSMQNDYDYEQNDRCNQQNYRTATVTPPEREPSSSFKKLESEENSGNSRSPLSSSFHMEEGRESYNDDMRYRNCSEEVGNDSKTCHESGSGSNPVNNANLENTNTTMMSHINYNNNLIGSVPFDQHLNFINNPTRRRACGSSDGGGGGGGEGKQKGKKQGPPSGNKTPFSIESLLAHSNNWRRNQNQDFSPEGGGRSGTGKEARFLPYVIPHQAHEQLRTSSRQGSPDDCRSKAGKNSASIQQHSENDKRPESHEGTNGSKSGGNGRRAGKSKRVRTIFTPEQLERLEAEFERQQYMVGPERLYLASSLYLTEAQVKVWFQNRRIKWRKQHLEMEQQRLAIYRTLAEQDMTSSVEDDDQEDSVDCEYGVEEGDPGGVVIDDDHDHDDRSVHSPSSSSRGNPIHHHPHPPPPPPHPPHQHQQQHPSNNMFSPISENKLDLQQQLQAHPLRNNSHNLGTAPAPVPPPQQQFKATHSPHISSKLPDARFSQQRQSPSIDDYDCSSTTSSPSSSSRGGAIQVGVASHVVVQAGKK